MSFVQKLGVCAALIVIFFFAAETVAMPAWLRYVLYYGMLGVTGYGVWLVYKNSSAPEPPHEK